MTLVCQVKPSKKVKDKINRNKTKMTIPLLYINPSLGKKNE